MKIYRIMTILLLAIFLLTGCNYPPYLTPSSQPFSSTINEWKLTTTPFSADTSVPLPTPTAHSTEISSTSNPTTTLMPSTQTPTPELIQPTENPGPKVFLHPGLSPSLISQLGLNSDQIIDDENLAQTKVLMSASGSEQAQ